jgi:N-ethylmaleimide reductase
MSKAAAPGSLFQPYALGSLQLANRVVMAPMTRSRAIGNVASELIAEYYAERASAGLIVAEGTAPSPNALGYARIPGVFSSAQVEGWRKVSDAVHARGGKIFVQLMHTGRISHPLNLPSGGRVLAPSAVRAEQKMHTDQEGSVDLPEPTAMTLSDIEQAKREFAEAAKNAIDAGLDGVELHGANGYLLEQFVSPHTNRRDDAYGGSIENRNRFALEVAGAVARAAGPERLGFRVSPHNVVNDMRVFEEAHDQYVALAKGLSELGLAYLHIVRTPDPGAIPTARALREAFKATLILNSGFDRESAEVALVEGAADLIAFGRPFLANPDLVRRLETRSELAAPDFSKLFTPGPEGYLGYAALA